MNEWTTYAKGGKELLLWSFLTVAVIGLLAVAGWMLLNWMAYDVRESGRSERPSPSDCAIVLGAYTDGYQPSPTLKARLRASLHLYRLGYISYFIVSGGQGADETVSESRSMKRFLILNGVPPHVILEDQYSNDTWENLSNSLRVMEEHSFRTAIVVTSDYHLPRALAVAEQLGIQATGFAAWTTAAEIRYARREVMARVVYTVRGQAAFVRKGRR
jgi:vancomycin permeability regulator SanA